MSIPQSTADESVTQALRRAFSSFPTGVVAVCAVDQNQNPVGMAVNSFTSISLDPPLVAISVARTSRTWPVLSQAQTLGLSVLGSEQEQTSRRLSARSGDRFADISWASTPEGAVHIDGAALWLTCRVYEVVDAGDHVIVLLAIEDVEHFPKVEPLVFHQSRYRAIRG